MEFTEESSPPAAAPPILTARIIPREEHRITREMISQDALYVLQKLNRAGFSAYLVGGGVRDLYLGKEPKDFDISTDARPGQIRKLFPNSRTIGRRFRLVQVFFRDGRVIEVSTLRSLSEHDLDGPQAVLAPNNTFGSLDEDAQRRDLTINSLFYEIENFTIIDYVNGVEDLDRSIIRIVGDPDKRINRDPVRMMRAIRHAARNGFSIEEHSWRAICDNHRKLQLCPPSRLRDEALKDIFSGAAAAWFNLATESGIFLDLFRIYRECLYATLDNGISCHRQLADIFTMIDRINTVAAVNGAKRQPDYFMLALILIPWAEAGYGLFSQKLKGSALFQTGKKIRADIDRELGVQLNLSRFIRQDISTLLTNLSALIHNRQDGSWPKWLRKKSYFNQCSLFYDCYMEVVSGEKVDDTNFSASHHAHSAHNTHNTHDDTRNAPSSDPPKHSADKRNKPAFAPGSKKGIFGLKK